MLVKYRLHKYKYILILIKKYLKSLYHASPKVERDSANVISETDLSSQAADMPFDYLYSSGEVQHRPHDIVRASASELDLLLPTMNLNFEG